MYQALLTRRYLTSKIMPLLAAVAVMLCTAMVLIVWSVMGGFLNMLVESGRTLIGDVSISHFSGFAYYEDLIDRLEADPRVEAATPMIETYGLIKLPASSAPNQVVVKGIEAASFDRVTGYGTSLWWKPLDEPLPKDKERKDLRLDPARRTELQGYFDRAMEFGAEGQTPPAVIGLEVGGYNERMPGGYVEPLYELFGSEATLSAIAMDRRGRVLPDQQVRRFEIVNQFRSGLYEIDARTVFVPLGALQGMLKMDRAVQSAPPALLVDPETGEERFEAPAGAETVLPARVSTVLVKGRGIDAEELRDVAEQVYDAFARAHAGDPTPPPLGLRVQTWRDQHATLIAAVEKETLLVLTIFGIISLTAVFLVLAIFWAMVSEKTKDIGVLRAIGASRGGVAWLWLRYGLVIGVVGSILGGIAAYLVVTNINMIHEWIAQGTAWVSGLFGESKAMYLWDPKVYYFSEIPSKIEPWKAVIVLVGGLLASVAGALVPAIKAARMDPVRALRWE